MNDLALARAMNFDWVLQLSSVWEDSPYDASELHRAVRFDFETKLDEMRSEGAPQSPPGWVVVGRGGAGKTHLLGRFRAAAILRETTFVLVDMTDIRDFWDLVLQSYVQSIQHRVYQNDSQLDRILIAIIESMRPKNKDSAEILTILKTRTDEDFIKALKKIVQTLATYYPIDIRKYQDVLRATICLNHWDFEISGVGSTWLQWGEIEESERIAFGFKDRSKRPIEIVRGLSWLSSLRGPTVLAFDQIDAIVSEYNNYTKMKSGDDRAIASAAIIQQIGAGLGSLRDQTYHTLSVVSCLESSWNILKTTTLESFLARFDIPPRKLDTVSVEGKMVESLIRNRLAIAYKKVGFDPPYPTWPIRPRAIAELKANTPREILQICEQWRKSRLDQGFIEETDSLRTIEIQENKSSSDPVFARLDVEFENQRASAEIHRLFEEKCDDERLAPLIQTALACLAHEIDTPENIAFEVDPFSKKGSEVPPLHARLRIIHLDENEREEHFSIRFLQWNNPRAFQNRLKKAMIQAGIDASLPFRRLAIVRRGKIPGGAETQKLVDLFVSEGGVFIEPSDEEIRSLSAISQLKQMNDPEFVSWLRSRKPLSNLKLIRAAVPTPLVTREDTRTTGSTFEAKSKGEPKPVRGSAVATIKNETIPAPAISTATATVSLHLGGTPAIPTSTDSTPVKTTESPAPAIAAAAEPASRVNDSERAPAIAAAAEPAVSPRSNGGFDPSTARASDLTDSCPEICLGIKFIGGKPEEPLYTSMRSLERHVFVVAGPGSGKSVLLRRIVEEAALSGVPSIVIDVANDLASLDERRVDRPEGWIEGDGERAAVYHDRTDVVIWTPGRETGNPLAFEPLPDFSAAGDDGDEIEAMIAMARESLESIVASGKGGASEQKKGILSKALRHLANQRSSSLNRLVELLEDLPAELGLGISNAAKLARTMADTLKSRVETNPMLRSSGAPLDPAILFGDDRRSEKTRISVVNLDGLAGLESKQVFVNQLAMTLFGWIKRRPDPGRALRGLLIIDEAKDFVPSQAASICKQSLARLTAQARKYHLGVIFATQNPKDIDNKIVANCSTHYYGKANSPAAIDAVEELIRQKGGTGGDVARLTTGTFRVHNADLNLSEPVKVLVPNCLSVHRSHPLEVDEITAKARACRERIYRE